MHWEEDGDDDSGDAKSLSITDHVAEQGELEEGRNSFQRWKKSGLLYVFNEPLPLSAGVELFRFNIELWSI